MEPKDLDIDRMPLQVNAPQGQGISSVHEGGANVLFGDGARQVILETLAPEDLRKLLEIDDGRPVHLGDRSRSVRFGPHMSKHLEGGASEGLLHMRQKCIERDGLNVAVQTLQLGNPARSEQIRTGRQHLPKLHESRPQVLERVPDALLRLKVRSLGKLSPVQELTRTLKGRRGSSSPPSA